MGKINYNIGNEYIVIDYKNYIIPNNQRIKKFETKYCGINYLFCELFDHKTLIINKSFKKIFENDLGLKVYNDLNNNYIITFDYEKDFYIKAVEYNFTKEKAKIYIVDREIHDKSISLIENTPFQMLFMLYLSNKKKFLLHSSLINVFNDSGICFCGESGKGKTTISKLFSQYSNSTVLTDETVLIDYEDEVKILGYGTPWKGSGANFYSTKGVTLKKIYIIEHGLINYEENLNFKDAVLVISKQSFPYFWDKNLLYNNFNKIKKCLMNLEIKRLYFYPDSKIVKFIKEENYA